jgi:hypothetical protein
MDQSYPEPFTGCAELQLPARRPRLSTLITSSANKPVSRRFIIKICPLEATKMRRWP